jgi:hypothetical protein
MQSLTFNPYTDLTGFVTTIALVLMPLSYAAQARFAQQRKAHDYAANINEILLMRQRNSNAGVHFFQTGQPSEHVDAIYDAILLHWMYLPKRSCICLEICFFRGLLELEYAVREMVMLQYAEYVQVSVIKLFMESVTCLL